MAELHRTLVPQPMSLTPYPDHTCPRPVNMYGHRIQVTAFYDEFQRTVERWQFSDEDVRYYHVEKWVETKTVVTVEKRAPIS